MNIAERATRLEQESGERIENYPYSDEDYRRIAQLSGLDKLRGVRDHSLRKLCWALYWIAEAGSPPPRSDEWRMSDDDFDPSRPKIPPETNGLLRAEWDSFNKKMDAWSSGRYRDTGVMVSDSDKRVHTARFAAILRKRYGATYPETQEPVLP
jgi:hypothetical protein